MDQIPFTPWRWRRAEYDRLVDLGAFHGQALELIDGQLIAAEPQGAYHASAISAVDYAVRAVLPSGWIVRSQAPVSLDDESEPEPDLVVVPGRPADYRAAHPSRPVLAIEVAESSLAFDRQSKGSLYARAGIADYWIVNLAERVLEVYRDVLAAIDLHRLHQVSFWDGLIVRAAKEGGCSTIYTEDLQDGRAIDGVRIVNPFR
jgi:Uma2 family endonuclease